MTEPTEAEMEWPMDKPIAAFCAAWPSFVEWWTSLDNGYGRKFTIKDIPPEPFEAAAQASGDAPWTKNLVMSLSRDENGQVIGVEGMFMVRTANVVLLPESLRAAAEALLERAGLIPIYGATEDEPKGEGDAET